MRQGATAGSDAVAAFLVMFTIFAILSCAARTVSDAMASSGTEEGLNLPRRRLDAGGYV